MNKEIKNTAAESFPEAVETAVSTGTEPAEATISPIELPDNPGRWVKRLVSGALVGVGAILPGVSGGAFCAAFGIYRPMMDFFAHPTRNFKKNARFFIPFLIGCGLGFVLLSGLVNWLLGLAATVVTAFFIGCIGGTMPSLYKEADGVNWKTGHWITVAASAGLTVWGLLSMSNVESMQHLLDQPKSLTYLITWIVCGVVFALGSIVPGMSPSSIIMYAGLYEPMTAGIARLNMGILLPFVLGVVLCIILFSKLISFLFSKAGRFMYSFIIGVVLGSTILLTYAQVITPLLLFGALWEYIAAPLCAVAGFVLVLLLAKLDPR